MNEEGEKKEELTLSLAAMHRLLLKGGAERAGLDAVRELGVAIENLGLLISRQAVEFAHHAERKTVTLNDMRLAGLTILKVATRFDRPHQPPRDECPSCGRPGTGPYQKTIKGGTYLYMKHSVNGKDEECYVARRVQEKEMELRHRYVGDTWKKVRNERERLVARSYESRGYQYLKHGWPDFVFYKAEEPRDVVFVEVKGPHDHLTPEQKKMHRVLKGFGLNALVVHVPFARRPRGQAQES